MSGDTEQKMNELNYKLKAVSEKQHHNQLAIHKQDQRELELDRLRSQGHRTFERILETWHKDRELGHVFLHMRQDIQRMERELSNDLENQKEVLQKEKKNLSDQEHELYYERQNLSEKVKS